MCECKNNTFYKAEFVGLCMFIVAQLFYSTTAAMSGMVPGISTLAVEHRMESMCCYSMNPNSYLCSQIVVY
jgi:hypothetical protein